MPSRQFSKPCEASRSSASQHLPFGFRVVARIRRHCALDGRFLTDPTERAGYLHSVSQGTVSCKVLLNGARARSLSAARVTAARLSRANAAYIASNVFTWLAE